MTQLASFCGEENYFSTVPSASVMVWPLKLIVPVKLELFFRVESSVEMLSTVMALFRVWASAVSSTCAPFLPAVPQPWEAELPAMVIRLAVLCP